MQVTWHHFDDLHRNERGTNRILCHLRFRSRCIFQIPITAPLVIQCNRWHTTQVTDDYICISITPLWRHAGQKALNIIDENYLKKFAFSHYAQSIQFPLIRKMNLVSKWRLFHRFLTCETKHGENSKKIAFSHYTQSIQFSLIRKMNLVSKCKWFRPFWLGKSTENGNFPIDLKGCHKSMVDIGRIERSRWISHHLATAELPVKLRSNVEWMPKVPND